MELVAVLVILAVIAAAVFPRLLDASDGARDAVNAQVSASFATGIAFARSTWLIDGKPQGSAANQGPLVSIDGVNVRVDPQTGYPVGNGGTDNADAMSLNDCITAFNDVVRHSYTLERRNQVNLSTYRDFDLIVTRTNQNPDVCNYYWSVSLLTLPSNANPGQGQGFRYFAGTGAVTTFTFP